MIPLNDTIHQWDVHLRQQVQCQQGMSNLTDNIHSDNLHLHKKLEVWKENHL
jgi:hypothetical protein